MVTLSNVKTRGGETNPSSVSLAADACPESKNTRNGVSVEYAYDSTFVAKSNTIKNKPGGVKSPVILLQPF